MLTDNEIKNKVEDLLQFNALSDTLNEVIIGSSTPLTIGLYGEWGSGKTSLMRMTQESLYNDNTVKTIWFDAWKFDKSYDLRVALIQSILNKMGKDKTVKQSVLNMIKELFNGINKRGLGMIIINQVLPRPITSAETNEPLFPEETLELIGDFEKKFLKIIKEYVGENGKLVVFIDDLDRCIPQNTVDTLEAIKLFLNVEHSVFIIGADKKVIETGILQKYPKMYEDWGKKYLDKIIQIPFFLPPLRAEIIIDEFIPGLKISDEIKEYKGIIAEVGSNPRTIKRLINQFELQSLLAKKQKISVDSEIMAKLNVIQFIHPEFHSALVEMCLENNMNLIKIFRKIYSGSQEAKDEHLKKYKYIENIFNDEKFIKFLLEEPKLDNVPLEDYFYLVKSTTNIKEEANSITRGAILHGAEQLDRIF